MGEGKAGVNFYVMDIIFRESVLQSNVKAQVSGLYAVPAYSGTQSLAGQYRLSRENARIMIKNIVFDMGKVLVDYDEDKCVNYYVEDEMDRYRVKTEMFISPEWLMLDMGVLTEESAVLRILKRLPERLHEAAKLCFKNWHLHCMEMVQEFVPLIHWLKEQGFGVYLLSNASVRLPRCYRDVIPAVDCFDGILFSAEEKVMKPQRQIYERLFEKFNLNPAECYFVDDLQLNIDGAKACGMDGYCFADRDVEKLKLKLSEFAAKLRVTQLAD